MDDVDVFPVVTERDRVEAWRLRELLRAGFPVELAEQVAVSEADLHQAIDLVGVGCSYELAAEILI